jgi:hypothetical protein
MYSVLVISRYKDVDLKSWMTSSLLYNIMLDYYEVKIAALSTEISELVN